MFSSILLQNDHKFNALLKKNEAISPLGHSTSENIRSVILSLSSRRSSPRLPCFLLDDQVCALSLTSSSSLLRSAVAVLPFGAVFSPPYTSVEMP